MSGFCADALDSPTQHIDVGGPEVFTYREIAELAFEILEKPRMIMSFPRNLVAAAVGALRWLAPIKT